MKEFLNTFDFKKIHTLDACVDFWTGLGFLGGLESLEYDQLANLAMLYHKTALCLCDTKNENLLKCDVVLFPLMRRTYINLNCPTNIFDLFDLIVDNLSTLYGFYEKRMIDRDRGRNIDPEAEAVCDYSWWITKKFKNEL